MEQSEPQAPARGCLCERRESAPGPRSRLDLVTLKLGDVSHRVAHMLSIPKVSRTPILRPNHERLGKMPRLAQASRRPRLELVADNVGVTLTTRYDDVYVIGSHIEGVQRPRPNCTMIGNRTRDDRSLRSVEKHRSIRQAESICIAPPPVESRGGGTPCIMSRIYAAARVARQPRALAGPGQQVRARAGHGPNINRTRYALPLSSLETSCGESSFSHKHPRAGAWGSDYAERSHG
jgi:hypothetical protein